MKYKCKVLTDEFYRKVQEELEELTKEIVGFQKIFEQNRYWTYFNFIWNGELKSEYLVDKGLDTPEYTEQNFDKQDKRFQSQPKILWVGEICKIDDINQIISYERID